MHPLRCCCGCSGLGDQAPVCLDGSGQMRCLGQGLSCVCPGNVVTPLGCGLCCKGTEVSTSPLRTSHYIFVKSFVIVGYLRAWNRSTRLWLFLLDRCLGLRMCQVAAVGFVHPWTQHSGSFMDAGMQQPCHSTCMACAGHWDACLVVASFPSRRARALICLDPRGPPWLAAQKSPLHRQSRPASLA